MTDVTVLTEEQAIALLRQQLDLPDDWDPVVFVAGFHAGQARTVAAFTAADPTHGGFTLNVPAQVLDLVTAMVLLFGWEVTTTELPDGNVAVKATKASE